MPHPGASLDNSIQRAQHKRALDEQRRLAREKEVAGPTPEETKLIAEEKESAAEKELAILKSKSVLERDVEKGQELFGKEFEEGALGRLDVDRSADIRDIIARRKAALGGLSAEENQALRERGIEGIQRGTSTALRQLQGRLGASGVRGATAGALQSRILQGGIQARANVERDLLIQNIQEKRTALGGFESSVTGAESGEEARRLFNLQQQQRETFGRVSTGLGFAQLGVQERASERGVAAAQAQAGGGGGKK